MKIQQLLETELTRYQDEWLKDERPVIKMPARTGGRQSNATCVNAYSVHYGLTMLGIKSPKRWNSVFASTSPDESMFLTGVAEGGGFRKIVLPDDRLCGWVKDDFNADYFDLGFDNIVLYMKNWFHEMAESKDLAEQEVEQFKHHAQALYDILTTHHCSDSGYQDYLELAELLDGVLKQYNKPTFSDQMKARLVDLTTKKFIGVATYSTLPEGNFEVWFEGEYEAHYLEPVDVDEDDDWDR